MKRTREKKTAIHKAERTVVLALSIALFSTAVFSCAPQLSGTATTANNNETGVGLMNARVRFDYNDFYSLTAPNANGCAGDAMNFYDAIALSSGSKPSAFASTGSTGTIRPSFIKNVSVDLTDANSSSASNLAFNCSNQTAAAPSACATFDYPDDGGVTSTLAGSVLLFGGVQGVNYSGINSVVTDPNPGLAVDCGPSNSSYSTNCLTSLYALGVDSLPASAATDPVNSLVPGLESASSPISSFVNLTATGPADFAGAAGAYDSSTGSLVLFGGSTVIGALSGTGQSATSDVTWLFNVVSQSWTDTTAISAETDFEGTLEITANTSEATLANIPTARSIFGYAAVPGMSLSSMGTTGTLPAVAGAPSLSDRVDHTDMIVIAGGLQGAGTYVADSYKLNPTYGPEWVDTLGRATASGSQAPAAGELVQWLDSYFISPLYNTTTAAELLQTYLGNDPTTNAIAPGNFGFAPLRDNGATTYGSGYALLMGGFDTSQTTTTLNTSTDSCPAGGGKCGMMIMGRTDRLLTAAAGAGETFPANFSSIGNLSIGSLIANPTMTNAQGSTTQMAPSVWNSYTGSPSGTATPTVPFYGGSTLLPGFNLETNDVVFFGGSTCGSYILSVNDCGVAPSFANVGGYYVMGQDPMAAAATVPSRVAFLGAESAPARAGMAAARGVDPSGNPVIVAFGGMSASGTGSDNSIYYLYNESGSNPAKPVWGSYLPTNAGPSPVTNGTLVFSHATGSFYLFGGYSPVSGSDNSHLWQLSFKNSGSCGVTASTTGTCQFTWTQLDVTSGVVCTPSCPQARRSHRMVEVNYFNRNPGGTVGGVTSGESTCSSTAPCSYGIFMEGGLSQESATLSDRWMFDPTANNGYGAWQQIVTDLPGRTLSSMASVDYTPYSGGTAQHIAVMFGGETGYADPSMSQSTGKYFVPPTLGDTWMYDYNANTWNRVTLLGRGYNGVPADPSTYINSETDQRQAYDALSPTTTDPRSTNNNLAELSPPPTSGAMMVTRTLSGPQSVSGVAAASLAIPEVYLIGGRLKDGSFQTFDHVYKFCAGSTGEAYTGSPGVYNPNDYSCDAYNASTNTASLSPQTGYVGRWLRKQPTSVTNGGATTAYSSFMGAAAYDSVDDLIVVFGGLQFETTNTAVTDFSNNRTASTGIFEYTAPSSAASQGAWTLQTSCAGSPVPTPRYGHSMVYDTQHQQLTVVGGFDVDGDALTQTVTAYNGSYSIPDMWTAKRTSNGSGGYCYTWTQVNTIGNAVSTGTPSGTGLAHMVAAYIPSTGYNTGYYSTFNSSCTNEGPANNGLNGGGAYFDIDRTQLGPNENLLLNLTFIPLGSSNEGPNSTALTTADNAQFNIYLVATGLSASSLESAQQPRYYTYYDSLSYPAVVQTLSVISPPTGQLKQEQILIPLTDNPDIDRIRVERATGSAILIDAAIYRMGYK